MEKRQENKDKKIKCPELQDTNEILCLASSEGLMVPSIYELVNFCLSGQYKSCPVKTESASQRDKWKI
ncbi:MAG: hypothetical protein WAX79_04570 [Candidatus Omnitrophota bacterium]